MNTVDTKEMIFAIYGINSPICCVLSYVLNSALAYCVWRHTRADMRDYAALMLMTCGLDVVLSTLDVVCGIVAGRTLNYRYYTFNGAIGIWLTENTPLSPQVLTYAYIFLAFILPSWGTIQFLLRYLIVCRQQHFSVYMWLGLTTASSLCIIFMLVNMATLNDPTQYTSPALIMPVAENFEILPTNVRFSVVMALGDPLFRLNGYFFRGYTLLLFVLMCVCGWRILHFSSRGPNQKSFARQISLTLTIQGVLPFQSLIVSLISITSLRSNPTRPVRWFFTLSTLPYAWLPVLNPLITLLLIRAYRRGLALLVVRLFDRLRTAVVTAPPSVGTIALRPRSAGSGGTWVHSASSRTGQGPVFVTRSALVLRY